MLSVNELGHVISQVSAFSVSHELTVSIRPEEYFEASTAATNGRL